MDAQSVYSGSMMFTHEEVTGEIQMGVSYSDAGNTLKVSINKVRGLTPPNKIDEDHTNPYVTFVPYLYLLLLIVTFMFFINII